MSHDTPCEDLKKCKMSTEERLDLILERMDELALRQANMAEIIIAWNNGKSFIRTIQTISKILRWVSLTSAAIAAIWYFFTHGSMPK